MSIDDSSLVKLGRAVVPPGSTKKQVATGHLRSGETIRVKSLMERMDRHGRVTKPAAKKTVKRRQARSGG